MDKQSLLAERIERAALLDLYQATPCATRAQLGWRLETMGTALVSLAEREPNILLNRVIGLGVEAPEHPGTVEAIAQRYAAAGINEFFLHLCPDAQPPALRDGVIQAGLIKSRGWMKFLREPVAPPDVSSDLHVQRIGVAHAEAFARIAAPAFDLSEAALPLIAALADRPGWHLYLSFDGDIPAGAGAMFVQDEVAYFEWGATLPAYRRRGGQGAVMAQRIRDAVTLGCRWLTTMTGEAVDGDPQHSYHNILRMGFQPTYLRENYSGAVASQDGWAKTGAITP
jgi:hypothetical protein